MKRIGIIEVGSMFTKGYVSFGGSVESRPILHIEFKKNHESDGTVREADLEQLVSYATRLRKETEQIHVLGTSAFRKMTQTDVAMVRARLSTLENVSFEVVSAAMENEYTCDGAIQNLRFDGPIGVMVGGGGSTEVSVYRDGKSIARAHSSIGVGDVNRAFPDLSEDTATSEPGVVVSWITDRLEKVATSADLLVLAGGDFPLLYANAGYALFDNPYSDDPNKPYALLTSDKNERDTTYFRDLALSKFRPLTPDTPGWWNGTRAMCAFVSAVAKQLGAEILIPTRISMVYGVAARLEDRS